MTARTKIVVAMSGGVDSSVAAALLVSQGYEVIGMMLRLWSENGQEAYNRCCTPEAMGFARRVAAHLEIPFYALDVRQRFRDTVVQFFIDGYAQGITPNPCMVCNREIRWGFLLQHALRLGADKMATGHYARISADSGGSYILSRGVDRHKDQSYVLSVLRQDQLKHAVFPIGQLPKQEVRALAADYNLPVAARPDSQDLCFITTGDYRDFLATHAPETLIPGPIRDQTGAILGEHPGLAGFTIGQRKGLGLSAPEPYYVHDKDIRTNALIVGGKIGLEKRQLIAGEVNWVAGRPPEAPFNAAIQVRYQAAEVPGQVFPINQNRFKVIFDTPVRGVTPGQIAALYQGDDCLGSGIIEIESGH